MLKETEARALNGSLELCANEARLNECMLATEERLEVRLAEVLATRSRKGCRRPDCPPSDGYGHLSRARTIDFRLCALALAS